MRFTHPVTLLNPGPAVEHPKTHNMIPGPDVPTETVGELQPVTTSTEAADGSRTVIAQWLLLLPPGDPVTAATRVQHTGRTFEVVGDPAPMSTGSGIPSHIHVPLNLVSDLQESS